MASKSYMACGASRAHFVPLIVNLCCVLLIADLQGCAAPFLTKSKYLEADNNFPGLEELFKKGRAQAVFVHGMGTHYPDWSAPMRKRLARGLELQELAGPNCRQQKYLLGGKAQLLTADYVNPDRSKFLRSYEVVWSPLTDDAKQRMNKADNLDGFTEKRVLANKWLKDLMNNYFVDPVIYTGSQGNPIREAMKEAVRQIITDDLDQPCDARNQENVQPPARRDARDDSVVLFGHSLGSRIIYDALLALSAPAPNNSPRTMESLRRFANKIRVIYMMANQIALLDMSGAVDQTKASGGSISTLMQLIDQGRPLDIIAFSDPNDILTYPLQREACEQFRTKFLVNCANVFVSVGDVVMDAFVMPTSAHTKYMVNDDVIYAIQKGWPAAGRVQQMVAPAVLER